VLLQQPLARELEQNDRPVVLQRTIEQPGAERSKFVLTGIAEVESILDLLKMVGQREEGQQVGRRNIAREATQAVPLGVSEYTNRHAQRLLRTGGGVPQRTGADDRRPAGRAL
jgi:hypothetical protein